MRYPLLALIVASVLGSCDSGMPDRSQLSKGAGPGRGQVHDFGTVSLKNGPVTLSHTFRVVNPTEIPLRVRAVKPTCGCLKATLDRDIIPPADVAELALSMQVGNPGRVSHGATVIFENNSIADFELSAHGTLGVELVPIRDVATIDPRRQTYSLQLCIINSDGLVETQAPYVVEPQGISVAFDGWKTIEDPIAGVRPCRQWGHVTLDFRCFEATYPVEVTLGTKNGGRCSFAIESP